MSFSSHARIRRTIPYYKIVRKVAFPSMPRILASIFAANLLGVALAFTLFEFSVEAFINGLAFGMIVLTIPSIVSDLLLHALVLNKDPLFYLRRCFALSLFSCLLWLAVMIVAGVASRLLNGILFPELPFYLGFFIVLPVRTISTLSMSMSTLGRKVVSSISQPFACALTGIALWRFPMTTGLATFLLSSFLAFSLTAALLIYIERKGLMKIGSSPLRIFRAFLLDWLDGRNEMFEDYLKDLGIRENVSVSLLQFRSKNNRRLKAIITISNFHPGPFLNVGSSVLPLLIQKVLESKTGAAVSVPHGVSGHELNLISQEENETVLREALRLLDAPDFSNEASRFIRWKSELAQASCQVFGDCALTTLTLSPRDMEDIPLEVGSTISVEANRYFKNVAIVDAHNSINEVRVMTGDEIESLVETARRSIETASGTSRSSFRIGTSKVDLSPYRLSQGIGLGGAVVLLVEAQGELSAYITVDGNNMKAGFREKLLNELRQIGVDEGEVMTTDTHMVNGIVPARLGYYPVGEAADEDEIIARIINGVNEARRSLEEAEVACTNGKVKVMVLGLGTFGKLTEFLYGVAKLVAIWMVVIMTISTFIGMVVLA